MHEGGGGTIEGGDGTKEKGVGGQLVRGPCGKGLQMLVAGPPCMWGRLQSVMMRPTP